MRRDSREYVRSIAARALEISSAQRQTYVVSACEKDPDAIREVLDLIRLAQMSTGTASPRTVKPPRDKRNIGGNRSSGRSRSSITGSGFSNLSTRAAWARYMPRWS